MDSRQLNDCMPTPTIKEPPAALCSGGNTEDRMKDELRSIFSDTCSARTGQAVFERR